MARKSIVTFAGVQSGGRAGVFVGRMNPMHMGHQAVIRGIIETFGDSHLILIGSCNHPISIRHLFNYRDRVAFIRAVFPNARLAPLPDFEKDDETWFQALDDLLRIGGIDPKKALYVGGSREDVEFYYNNGRDVHIINRYNGPTIKISGSEVRDALIDRRHQTLRRVLDPQVYELVRVCFETRWNEVRQR